MEKLCFKVADLCFSIEAPSASMIKKLLPSYAPFYVAEGEDSNSMLCVVVNNGVVDVNAEGEELGQFDVISTVEGHLASAMKTNADFSECVISLFGDEDDQRFGLGNAMMIAFAFAAAYYNVVLMHASVTMNNGYGYLFLGKSGTGKSTHSKLWRQYIEGSDLLNDDNPAVRAFDDGRVVVYGTPWSGKTPCYRNLQMPVGAYVRLEQYPENVIRQETRLETFASVLSSCSTMVWDKPSYDHITNTVSQIASKVSAYYLRCRADQEAAQLSYRTIAQHSK